MRNFARFLDKGWGVKRNRKVAATWFRKALSNGYTDGLNELISTPFNWSKSFRRELQRLLEDEGLYDGTVNGEVSAVFDDVLWNKAIAGLPEETKRLRQDFVRVKRSGVKKGLLVRICRFDSNTPQRLMLINHGLTSVRQKRRSLRPDPCGPVAEYFAKLGYVVAFPLRRGYGTTGGRFAEGGTNLRCGKPYHYIKAGREIAADIKSAMQHLFKLPYVASDKAVVFGHSGGGWGTVALSSENDPAIATYVNFSGAHGTQKGRPNGNCGTSSLAAAMRKFGKTARVPSLWLYVKNDTYVGPKFANRLKRAFEKSGGKIQFKMFDTYENEDHYLAGAQGLNIWGPVVADWLKTQSPPN